MSRPFRLVLGAALLLAPVSAQAGQRILVPAPAPGAAYPLGSDPGGRAPWMQPWEYDSGSDNDRRPELPYYQQNRATQSGGPARNLIPSDGFTISPR